MGNVVVLRYGGGRTFSNINSLAFIGGVAWGECYLPVVPLDFRAETMRRARGFGSCTLRQVHKKNMTNIAGSMS